MDGGGQRSRGVAGVASRLHFFWRLEGHLERLCFRVGQLGMEIEMSVTSRRVPRRLRLRGGRVPRRDISLLLRRWSRTRRRVEAERGDRLVTVGWEHINSKN